MYLAGIDLGGTNIKAGLVSEQLSLVCKTSIPTFAGRSPEDIIRDMADAVTGLAESNGIGIDQIKSVGIGIPGVSKSGVVIVHNLYWFDVPLKDTISKYLDMPIAIDNDATAAAVYEYHLGSLKGCSVGVLITLGTGVGGGIIINGKPFSGAHGLGSEIGHMAIDPNGIQCTCGNKGCLETLASAGALLRMGRRCVLMRPESKLYHMAGGDYRNLNTQMIFESAKNGDYIALDIIDQYAKYIAMGICTIENMLDPDVIALGGGISGAGDFLLDRVKKASEDKGIFEKQKYAEIKIAKSGNDAGLIGAAMLAM